MSQKTLWYTRCPVPTAFSIAVQNGWLSEEFQTEGIAVSSLLQSSDRNVRESHFAHTQPDSFRHGGNTPPLWARATGSDVRLIGLSWTVLSQDLLVRADSPVRNAGDLKGRRLGLPRRPNDSIDFWRAHVLQAYEQALASAGLGLDDVELVDLVAERRFIDGSGQPEAAGSLWNAFQMEGFQREETQALVRGEVDVIFSYGPRSLQKQALLGARVIHDLAASATRLEQTSNSLPLTFTVSGKLLDERPDLVARVLALTLQAAEWAKTHPTQTTRIVAREIGVAEEFIERAYGTDLAQSLAVDLSLENIEALRRRKDFLLQNGFLAQDIDLDAWIDHGPLQEARRLLASRTGNAA